MARSVEPPAWVAQQVSVDHFAAEKQLQERKKLEFVAQRKSATAAEKDRNSALATQQRLESSARASRKSCAALQPGTEVDVEMKDDFISKRRAEMATQQEKKMAFAKGEAERHVGSLAAQGHQTARSILARVTQPKLSRPPPAREMIAVRTPLRTPLRVHKNFKTPQKSLKTSNEAIRAKQEKSNRAHKRSCLRKAIRDRDELLEDYRKAVHSLNVLANNLREMFRVDPKRTKLQNELDILRETKTEIDRQLTDALHRIEQYAPDAEEQAEKEAFIAEIRTGNEIVAKQAALRRAPCAPTTTIAILDERNPWPDRPNYRPNKTRTPNFRR
ncbi:hypothetical protein E2P81_ATG04446 [Venturia nashicola]|uniref:Uncharacterized protein n=1 Tax=Venturia nashicola TaxID=86259 RepID=A0A4Z1PIT0_9PEZI|nr:hypothetical protein E6O75_ATG04551 [Venturia nashicola]TLD37634.1 hypothetical protein E2P81_ATG04446 [Venturia nashicola]